MGEGRWWVEWGSGEWGAGVTRVTVVGVRETARSGRCGHEEINPGPIRRLKGKLISNF
jgi:hypothetical protein